MYLFGSNYCQKLSLPTQFIILSDVWAKIIQIAHPVNYPDLTATFQEEQILNACMGISNVVAMMLGKTKVISAFPHNKASLTSIIIVQVQKG